MGVLGGIGINSSKSILDTLEPSKIKCRETSKKEITTSSQSVCSQKSSITCEIPSGLLKIQDINKTSIMGIPNMARRGNI